MTNPYPAEFRERALRMLAEARSDHPSDFAAASHVAGRLGDNPETLRFWKKRADVDASRGPGTTPEAQLEIRRLKTQIAESEKANEILRTASIFLPTELGRPASARAPSDQLTGGETVRVHAENYGICGICGVDSVDSVCGVSGVSGVRKMHRLLKRQGGEVGRDQTGCLMRFLESRGVKSGKRVFTIKPDPAGARPTDLVQRHFRAETPRRFWVVDVTYVRTWQGAAFAHGAFVSDPFSRRIVEFKVASTLNSDISPLQALHTAAFDASGNLTGLTHHSDHGSNSSAMTYTDRIAELGGIASTGTVGDFSDNRIAAAVNTPQTATDPRPRTLAHGPAARTCNPGMGAVVEQTTPPLSSSTTAPRQKPNTS